MAIGNKSVYKVTGVNGIRKVLRQIEKSISDTEKRQLDRRMSQAANFIQQKLADSVPGGNPYMRQAILSLSFRKNLSKHSGYYANLKSSGRFEYTLNISTRRSGTDSYYNPFWAIIVSNYGRRGFTAKGDNKLLIPVKNASQASKARGSSGRKSAIRLDDSLPAKSIALYLKRGYKYARFTKSVGPVVGSHWIENTISTYAKEAANIAVGNSSYVRSEEQKRLSGKKMNVRL